MNLKQAGEDRLLAQLLPTLSRNRSVVLGAGDDCAVVSGLAQGHLQLLKTDCVVEGVHFATKASPESIGWKAMARPLSDFAAMSGVPQFALVTLIVPANKTLAWTRKIYRGLEKAARSFQVVIVGGETSSSHGPSVISVSVIGFVEKDRWVGRAGGKPQDELFVTGRLGRIARREASQVHAKDRRVALADEAFSDSRDDGPKRWPGRRPAATRPREWSWL